MYEKILLVFAGLTLLQPRVAIAQSTSAPTVCYELRLGAWSPQMSDAEAAMHLVPRLVRLHAGGRLSPDIAYAMSRPLPGMPYWDHVADTLLLVWSNGFAPTQVRIYQRNRGWVGDAVAETDAHPIPPSPRPRALVSARRAACPTESPSSRS
jgi:hypothetical protein